LGTIASQTSNKQDIKTISNAASSRFLSYISQLPKAAQARLSVLVKSVAFSQLDDITLIEEEVVDIFNYLGINNLMSDKKDLIFSQLFVNLVASARHSKELYQNYTYIYSYEIEEYFPPSS